MIVVRRLTDAPIVHSGMFSSPGGENINGPSLIAAPAWLRNTLGKFYLYFAHHHGSSIRLATADRLEGPWTLHEGGSLQLSEAPGCDDHIASPDVHLSPGKEEVLMYFHGVVRGTNRQETFLARSIDGIRFTADEKPLADFYFRTVRWRDRWVAMSKGGIMYISDALDGSYDRLANAAFPMRHPQGNAPGDIRHVALRVAGDTLQVYFTRIGDKPESIFRAMVHLDQPAAGWKAGSSELVLAPAMAWEGARLPLTESRAGPAFRPQNALRDPALFEHEGRTYLLYSVAGEFGIGICEISE